MPKRIRRMKIVRAELPEELMMRFERITKLFNIKKTTFVRSAITLLVTAFEKHIVEETK